MKLRQVLLGMVAALLLITLSGQASPPIDERVVAVPAEETLLFFWDAPNANGTPTAHYGISLDGQTIDRIAEANYELGLMNTSFDPLRGLPAMAATLQADASSNLYVVQFVTQPLEIFADQIRAAGGTLHRYIAHYAWLVEMNPTTRVAVTALPYVRYVGPYHPAYRLEPYLRENLDAAATLFQREHYNIAVMTPAQKAIVSARIAAQGGFVETANAGKRLIEATLTPEQLLDVIRWDEILYVDRWSPLERDMDIVREISGANYIETVAGYTGAGVRGEVYDSGFNPGHHDFESRPLIHHGTTGSADHGSSTSGICFGDGAGNSIARGMLPDGQGIIADYNYTPMTGQSRYDHSAELIRDPYFAVFQTASVGSGRTFLYSNISADTDEMLFDLDLVHCQSQSNAGNQDSRPQAWAKNIISGGGVYHYGTLDKSDDRWNYGASIGPASDGRIKPTLCHFYDRTYTTACCSYESYTSSFGGTSGATPIIAGHVGLVFQMWADGIFGNDVTPGATVFENRCHMPTAKALLINTAEQYDFVGLTHDLTRMHQGWGMPDIQKLYDMRENIYVIDETDVLAPFEISTHQLLVEAGTPALKVTMTYADPPGNPAVQTQHRINDITLRVISPTSQEYYGNNGLDVGVWSEPGGVADTKNTVECVFVENPEPGTWTVEIRADEIIQDGHGETEGLDADYALVVTGILPIDLAAVEPGSDARAEPGLALGELGTQISYYLPRASSVKLTIHDLQGRTVATLAEGPRSVGEHRVTWDDRKHVQAGVYFVRLDTGSRQVSRRLLWLQ